MKAKPTHLFPPLHLELIIEDRALQELHRAGIAQEFNVRGTSGPYERRFSYTPTQPPSVSDPFSTPPTRRIP